MELVPSTIPGVGVLHHCRTRRGQRLSVLVEHSGTRSLLVDPRPGPDRRPGPGGHGPPGAAAPPGPSRSPSPYGADDGDDVPSVRLILEPDEADQIADLLHTRPIPDRLAVLEDRITRLTEELRS
ncbi:hypothetical protein [Spirillospora sp. NPDC047279]|uniref:hypothetical protein n=1 Tax=Spirillospora sp. NPDC047279 TaxID=3155478 RepID=UPI0033EEEA27